MTGPIPRLNAALEGRYRIERELGQGGMATVYLADDLKHERKVALKVLKPELAAVVGAERFLAEIKTTANLQHPHILPLFDSGEADGFLFYVMPYVEGESLRQRLDRERQLPVDEAVAIAKKVAGALHAAHGRGVIHRDIKPANILLAGGEPVVADFGIALAVQEAGGGRLTETGLSLGTPYYMSPEQATADRAPNAASDVYSLGCVLYEVLVGEPPYAGSSAQAVLGKIIAGDAPRAKDGRPAVPANVDAAVQKALEKLPADRFPTTEQFASALADPGFRAGPDAYGVSNKRGQPPIRLIWPTLAAAFGVLALFGWLRPEPTPAVPVSFDFHMPDGYDMVDGIIPILAVSPDGRTLAYRNGNRVYVRELDDFEGRPLAGTESVWHAFFSPNGETLGLLDGSSFRQIPAGGGPMVDLLGEQAEPEGGHWGEDGRIVFSAAWGYNGIRAATPGEPGTQQLTSVDAEAGESAHRWPQLLPDDLLLYTSTGPSWTWQDARVVVLDLQSGETTTIAEGATHGQFHHDGFVVYGNADGQLLAVSFDTRTKAVGTPQSIATDVMVAFWGGAVSFALAERGNTLAFVEGSNFERHSLLWVDRQGRRSQPIGPPLTNEWLSLSPDGRRVAMDVFDRRGADIFISDLDKWDPRRFTLDVAHNESPTWSPDGQSLAYTVAGVGGSTGIVIQALTPGSTPVTIAERPVWAKVTSWSPDGVWIAFQEAAAESSDDLYAIRTDGSGEIRPIATDQGRQFEAEISPDGRWVAYVSETSGRREIYIDAFPDLNARRQVTTGGGDLPRWVDDAEVTFVRGDTVFAQTVNLGSSFETVGRPVPLFHFSDHDFLSFPSYDDLFRYEVSPDGQRFLVRVHRPETLAREGRVMTGWLEQLERGS